MAGHLARNSGLQQRPKKQLAKFAGRPANSLPAAKVGLTVSPAVSPILSPAGPA